MKTCAAIINIFHLIPAASVKMIEPLTTLTLKGEKDLLMEAGSPFREPLIKFLLRYPQQTVELFLSDAKVRDYQWNRCFEVGGAVLHTCFIAELSKFCRSVEISEFSRI